VLKGKRLSKHSLRKIKFIEPLPYTPPVKENVIPETLKDEQDFSQETSPEIEVANEKVIDTDLKVKIKDNSSSSRNSNEKKYSKTKNEKSEASKNNNDEAKAPPTEKMTLHSWSWTFN